MVLVDVKSRIGNFSCTMSVLIQTSLGDIVIDVHCKDTPKTALNFLKLCKSKGKFTVVFCVCSDLWQCVVLLLLGARVRMAWSRNGSRQTLLC